MFFCFIVGDSYISNICILKNLHVCIQKAWYPCFSLVIVAPRHTSKAPSFTCTVRIFGSWKWIRQQLDVGKKVPLPGTPKCQNGKDLDVSENSGFSPQIIPFLYILIGFSIINHPFWDSLIFGNTHLSSSNHPFFFKCAFAFKLQRCI